MKSTDELLNMLQNSDSEELLEADDFENVNVSYYLGELLSKSNISPKEIIFGLNMERSYVYQILNGRRRPTRGFLIRIAFLCRLSTAETQRLLAVCHRPTLYPRNRSDAAVLYCLQHRLDENQLNRLLLKIGEKPLA